MLFPPPFDDDNLIDQCGIDRMDHPRQIPRLAPKVRCCFFSHQPPSYSINLKILYMCTVVCQGIRELSTCFGGCLRPTERGCLSSGMAPSKCVGPFRFDLRRSRVARRRPAAIGQFETFDRTLRQALECPIQSGNDPSAADLARHILGHCGQRWSLQKLGLPPHYEGINVRVH